MANVSTWMSVSEGMSSTECPLATQEQGPTLHVRRGHISFLWSCHLESPAIIMNPQTSLQTSIKERRDKLTVILNNDPSSWRVEWTAHFSGSLPNPGLRAIRVEGFMNQLFTFLPSYIWFCSVAESYLTLVTPVDCSPPSFSVHESKWSEVKVAQSCPTLYDPMDVIQSMEFSRSEYWRR